MLTFVGLGLYDERSITIAGREAVVNADRVFAEFYTSKLAGADVADLERSHGTDIEVRSRAGVERDPEPILNAATSGRVAFLTAGDPFISTTHTDLRIRAAERGIDTRVIHGVSAGSAAASLTGLQNYRFGKAVTLPFPASHGSEGVPPSVLEAIEANRERDLHTLVYLDIRAADEQFMRADEAAALLAADWQTDALGVAVARAGGHDPVVRANRLAALANLELGPPLHLLVVPGDLHHMEAAALSTFAGLPDGLGPD